ncbi:unnamed protein product [Lactuca virosa]|uniref:Kinesin-like protein n=1 Tax=Lactuca virosa TaxID=75947 RepID=A0AAU9NFJ7_9ASTR|nr:unnamed protein product [Lactuca virosa]
MQIGTKYRGKLLTREAQKLLLKLTCLQVKKFGGEFNNGREPWRIQTGDSSLKCANSLSSTALSSKHIPEASSSTMNSERLKENVSVTIRFRPLSPREIRQGEEIAWYADGETIVRNENTPSIAFAYDQVFGPTTTTRHLYDIAAQHVVSGAMEGINGTIFAYGVTSSGKTHTMHGNQRSPGIIPLAIKDAFCIIQETPCREFLLRLSYLEIYNEVVNDLLNPAGHHLRIREDNQGTFVEGVKQKLYYLLPMPFHYCSWRRAKTRCFHKVKSAQQQKSHNIYTGNIIFCTIESSPCGENIEGEAVNLSQLNLIDLAGSESSKAETTGIRRKEGAYINKSLLTLGTVISKLSDGRAAHIPYRDSKLTRLLQSSLSGHGRVSLICTVTPSSSNSEETHNTLKFAHHAKHIEIQAAQNKINDEKSLIKTYQNQIRSLKEELHQLEHEGEAKDALLSQIQSLTRLILVSTKSPHQTDPGSRYSFMEEELAYLPKRGRNLSLDHENIQLHVTLNEGTHIKDDKKIKKPQKRDGLTLTSGSDKSSGGMSTTSNPTPTPPANTHTLAIVESRRLSYSSPSESTSEPLQQVEVLTDSEAIQEQLNGKNNECKGLEETIKALKQLLSENTTIKAQAVEIEQLKQKVAKITESKEQLESENKRLREESAYANELASAAANELKMMSEQVVKLMNQGVV